MSERERLRATFEEVPELYDRARPLYPQELFDDLVSLAGLRAGARVVEIGCGTGQATRPLAERGLDVVCVELGPGLAALARRNLAAFPSVEVVNADFAKWAPAGGGGFDAVAAFTAFHWLDPEARYEQAARVLHPGGALAVVETQHVLPPGGDPFWIEVQEDYDAVLPSDDNRPPPHPDEVGDLRAELEASGRFGEVAVRRYLWTTTYTSDAYVAVLETFSGHRVVHATTRARLYDRIRRRIDARPGGTVTKTHLATLNLARLL